MFSKFFLFFQEAKREFKRVNWPSARETAKSTGIVIGLSLFMAAFLGVLDFAFSTFLQRLL